MKFNQEIENIIIISDIHGCHKTFIKLLNQLPKNVLICCVGDLIDRGPNSSAIIEEIMNNNYLSVIGNHEIMMLESCDEPYVCATNWLHQGGNETLKSYQKDFINYFDRTNNPLFIKHLNFIKSLPYFYQFSFIDKSIKPLVISHSMIFPYMDNKFKNIKNEIDYEFNTLQEIIWNRAILTDKLNNFGSNCDYFNIFGHTILKKPKITDNYGAIDTGSFLNLNDFTKAGGITALEYPSMKLYYQENIED